MTPYLFHTGSWIYNQIVEVKDFNQFVFTRKKENLDQFYINNIISVEDFGFFRNVINKIYNRLTDQYGLFFNEYINTNNINLFHAHMGFEACRWLEMAQKNKLPLITTFYGQDVSKLGRINYWLARYKKLFDYGEKFLVEGPFLRKQLVKLGCPESKIIIQKLGVEVNKYELKKYNSHNSKIIITQVSTFREKKGIEYSLKALFLLKKEFKDFEYWLIGGWDKEEDLNRIKKIINKLSLEKEVIIMGKLPHKEMISKLSVSDIFLHPSVTALDGDNEGGAPVSIIEASAVGLPIISTFHADIPEVVINKVTGLLSVEKNCEHIYLNIMELIDKPELRISMGSKGRSHMDSNFNLLYQTKKLSEIYSKTIG